MSTPKTAISVLQEMMVKLDSNPEYACLGQSGPPHRSVFKYECRALGVTASATAGNKKDAKQRAAHGVLRELARRGHPVEEPYAAASPVQPPADAVHSHVALLQELCEEYRLPGAEWRLVSDTGPAHSRRFEVSYSVGAHEQTAAASTKKAARQAAAASLYNYLRQNLTHITKDFREEDALVRAHEKVTARYKEVKEEVGWRPDLGLRLSDYHHALPFVHTVEEEVRARALTALDHEEGSERALELLGLQRQWTALDGVRDGDVVLVLEVLQSTPELAWAGIGSGAGGADVARARARRMADRYLRTILTPDPLPTSL